MKKLTEALGRLLRVSMPRLAVRCWCSTTVVAGFILAAGTVFALAPARPGDGPRIEGGLPTGTQPSSLQRHADQAERALPGDVAAAIESRFRGTKLLTEAWYQDHPTAWRPGDGVAAVATVTTWDQVAKWLALTTDPVYYGYGDNVVVTADGVYFAGQRAASSLDYAQAAAELAAASGRMPAATVRWGALGTFALVPPKRSTARAYVALWVTPDGLVRGTYVDAMTRQPATLQGGVNRAYQRVAWTTGTRGTTVFDSGLDNLTRRVAPLLIHYETERSEPWLAVRVEPDDRPAAPVPPDGDKESRGGPAQK